MKRTVLSWSIVVALTGAACHSDQVTNPAPATAAARALATGANLIECPSSVTTTTSAVVTPLGGLVSLGGTSISVPAGAVLVPTLIEVTLPASRYMEVDISVPGVEHFVFELPVTITVEYSRCTRSDIALSPLTAWYIDSETKALLEAMGGVDDKVARTVTFTTPHLSGYALAN
jgi:hypothetical protein